MFTMKNANLALSYIGLAVGVGLIVAGHHASAACALLLAVYSRLEFHHAS